MCTASFFSLICLLCIDRHIDCVERSVAASLYCVSLWLFRIILIIVPQWLEPSCSQDCFIIIFTVLLRSWTWRDSTGSMLAFDEDPEMSYHDPAFQTKGYNIGNLQMRKTATKLSSTSQWTCPNDAVNISSAWKYTACSKNLNKQYHNRFNLMKKTKGQMGRLPTPGSSYGKWPIVVRMLVMQSQSFSTGVS